MADARLTNTPKFNLEMYVEQLARNLDNHAQVLHDRDTTSLLNYYSNPVYIGPLSGFANNNQLSSSMTGDYGNLNAMFRFRY